MSIVSKFREPILPGAQKTFPDFYMNYFTLTMQVFADKVKQESWKISFNLGGVPSYVQALT